MSHSIISTDIMKEAKRLLTEESTRKKSDHDAANCLVLTVVGVSKLIVCTLHRDL